jgi:hypothetical protein
MISSAPPRAHGVDAPVRKCGKMNDGPVVFADFKFFRCPVFNDEHVVSQAITADISGSAARI